MPHIQIDDISPDITYVVGATARSSFPIPFAFFDNTDLVVTVGDTVMTLTEDYTVTGAGLTPPSAATVTLDVAVTDTTVRIERDVPIKRTTDFPASGPFQSDAMNTQLDKFVAMLQQLESRSLATAVGSNPPTWDAQGRRITDLGEATATTDAVTLAQLLGALTLPAIESSGNLFDSRAAVTVATIAGSINAIRTLGYSTGGDGGAADYRRVDVEPSHPGKVQSLDGAWFELAETEIDLRMFGSDGTVANDTAACHAVRQIVQTVPGTSMWIPPYEVLIDDDAALFFASGDVEIRGYGSRRSIIKAADSAELSHMIATTDTGSVTSFQMFDVGIDGNRTNMGMALSPSYAVLVQNDNVRIEYCIFTEIQTSCITAFNDPNRLDIHNNDFIGVGQSFDNGNNIAVGVGGGAEELYGTNNRFENFLPVEPILDVVCFNVMTSKATRVAMNTFRDIYNVVGGLSTIISGNNGADVITGVVMGNISENTNNGHSDDSYGLECNASGVVMIGNAVKGVKRGAIAVNGDVSGLLLASNMLASWGLDFAGTASAVHTQDDVGQVYVHGNMALSGTYAFDLGNAGGGAHERVVKDNYISVAGVSAALDPALGANDIVAYGDNYGHDKAWTAYTPGLPTSGSGNFLNVTRTGSFYREGTRGDVQIKLTIVDKGSAAGHLSVSLPSGFVTATDCSLTGFNRTQVKALSVDNVAGSPNLIVRYYDGTFPVTANNDEIVISGTVQIVYQKETP